MPDGLKAATRSARHQQVASVVLLASLVIGSGILAVVAMRPNQAPPIIDSGIGDRTAHTDRPEFMTMWSHREFDPFVDADLPNQGGRLTAIVQPVRLLPMTEERMNRLIAGEL